MLQVHELLGVFVVKFLWLLSQIVSQNVSNSFCISKTKTELLKLKMDWTGTNG